MTASRIEPEDLHAAFDSLAVDDLRRRRTMKWSEIDPDVLPAWVAEMDFPLAPIVLDAVRDVLARHDLGYAETDEFRAAFAGWARRHQGWVVDPDNSAPVADIMAGLELALRELTTPGDEVVLCTPAYPPFFALLGELRRRLRDCPLLDTEHGWRLDLDAIADALAGGARVVLLCHPHNPTGRVWSPAELRGLAELVDHYGARVISDEVHAPILAAGQEFTPYACSSPAAAAHTVTVTSVSKAWNVPGLKSAIVVSQPETAQVVRAIPEYEALRVSVPGVAAATALWQDDGGWLSALLSYLDRTRQAVREWVDGRADVRWHGGEAGYLAWLDLRATGLGDDPAAALLARGRVRLSSGPRYAPTGSTLGNGFVRLNHATSVPILRQVLTAVDSALDRR